jgi:Na+/melibiose symporter-like transporter
MMLVAAQLVYFSRLDASTTFWHLLPGLLVGGAGMALTMTPSAAAATRSLPVDKAGVGSAVLNSMRQVGGSLGIAVMGAIVAASITVLPGDPRLPGQFIDGYQNALHVAAAIALVGAVVAVLTVRKAHHPEVPVLEGA